MPRINLIEIREGLSAKCRESRLYEPTIVSRETFSAGRYDHVADRLCHLDGCGSDQPQKAEPQASHYRRRASASEAAKSVRHRGGIRQGKSAENDSSICRG